MENTGLGKILFADGWYDFESDEFHEGFTDEVLFHHKAPIT